MHLQPCGKQTDDVPVPVPARLGCLGICLIFLAVMMSAMHCMLRWLMYFGRFAVQPTFLDRQYSGHFSQTTQKKGIMYL